MAIFDFSQPGVLACGDGAMVVTDDDRLAIELRYLCQRSVKDRNAISVGARVPLQAGISELSAAMGVGQLARIDELLQRRKAIEALYLSEMSSFEGIKPPYIGQDVDEVHFMVWLVHLGTRFTASARKGPQAAGWPFTLPARMALVRGVILAAARAGSRQPVQ